MLNGASTNQRFLICFIQMYLTTVTFSSSAAAELNCDCDGLYALFSAFSHRQTTTDPLMWLRKRPPRCQHQQAAWTTPSSLPACALSLHHFTKNPSQPRAGAEFAQCSGDRMCNIRSDWSNWNISMTTELIHPLVKPVRCWFSHFLFCFLSSLLYFLVSFSYLLLLSSPTSSPFVFQGHLIPFPFLTQFVSTLSEQYCIVFITVLN